jgi:hypothetical protein
VKPKRRKRWLSSDVKSFRDLTTEVIGQPIIYRWWFKNAAVPGLLKNLKSEVKMGKIERQNGYALLYVGISLLASELETHQGLFNHSTPKNTFTIEEQGYILNRGR